MTERSFKEPVVLLPPITLDGDVIQNALKLVRARLATETREDDPRKTGLKNGLRQLTSAELRRVIDYPGEMVLDEVNYKDGCFCPLAIGLELDKTMPDPSHEKVFTALTEKGYTVYNTRGIEGEFYRDDRKRDLMTAALEVLAERDD